MNNKFVVVAAVVIAAVSAFARPHGGPHGGFRHGPPPMHHYRPPVHHCGWYRPALPRPAHCYAGYWAGVATGAALSGAVYGGTTVVAPSVTTTYVAPGSVTYGTSTVTYNAPLQTRQYYVTASGTIGQSVEAAAFSGAGGYAGVTTVVEPAAASVTVPTQTWVSPGWQYGPGGVRYFTPGHFVPRW